MSGVSIQGSTIPFYGSADTAKPATISASQAKEASKLFSSVRDTPINVTTANGEKVQIFINPKDLDKLKEMAKAEQRTNDGSKPLSITVMQDGKAFGTIDPSEYLKGK